MPRDAEKHKRLRRKWYLKNRELVKERAKAWSAANPERRQEILAKHRETHREERSAYNKAWFADNKDKRAAYQAKRRAVLLQRTPKWLTEEDLWMMEQAYELAQLRTEMFGFEWHVDHVIPLQGKKVCGFHMPENLAVIPGSDNCKKHASFLI